MKTIAILATATVLACGLPLANAAGADTDHNGKVSATESATRESEEQSGAGEADTESSILRAQYFQAESEFKSQLADARKEAARIREEAREQVHADAGVGVRGDERDVVHQHRIAGEPL